MYSKVEAKFWTDEKMRAVSNDARLLMLYILTAPHRNIIGLYFLPMPYLIFDLKWDAKRVVAALGELAEHGCVKYDDEKSVVFVRNYLKLNPLQNANQCTHACEKYSEIATTPLLQDFDAALTQFGNKHSETLLKLSQERLRNSSETLPEQFRNSSETLSLYNSNSNSNSNNNSSYSETKKSVLQDAKFDEFWEAYPRKDRKQPAKAVWAKLKVTDELFALIMAGLKRANASEQWTKEEGKYTPQAARWLKEERWNDQGVTLRQTIKIYREDELPPLPDWGEAYAK